MLENTRNNGFRIVVDGVSEQKQVELLLLDMPLFLEAVIEHAYLNCGIFPLAGEFSLDLKANTPKSSGKALNELREAGQPLVGQGRTFADIAGNDKIKKSTQALAEGIRNEERRKQLGIKLPKGVLFEGLPGTGKTLMAEAMANAGSCRFVFVDAQQIYTGGLVGDAENNTKKILEEARKQPPGVFTIIFFDDLDTIIGSRDIGFHEVTGKVLGLLLSYMDGVNRSDNVMFIGATNRRQDVDSALIRPGRFNMRLVFEPPNPKERRQLFDIHIKRIEKEANRTVFGRLKWEEIIAASEGMTQAAIAVALENANLTVNQDLLLGRSKRSKPVLVNHAVLMEELLRQKANESSEARKKKDIGFLALVEAQHGRKRKPGTGGAKVLR